MKKPLAIILLILGSVAAVAALALFNFILLVEAAYAGLLVGIACTFAAGFGLDAMRKLFREKYGLKAPLFLLSACAPSFAAAGIYYGVICYLDDIGYFEGFAGFGEFILGLTWFATAAAFAAAGGLWLLISFIIEKRRGAKS